MKPQKWIFISFLISSLWGNLAVFAQYPAVDGPPTPDTLKTSLRSIGGLSIYAYVSLPSFMGRIQNAPASYISEKNPLSTHTTLLGYQCLEEQMKAVADNFGSSGLKEQFKKQAVSTVNFMLVVVRGSVIDAKLCTPHIAVFEKTANIITCFNGQLAPTPNLKNNCKLLSKSGMATYAKALQDLENQRGPLKSSILKTANDLLEKMKTN